MKAEDLMNPRFEVISDYPNSPFSIGDILHKHFYTTSITGMYCYVTNKENPLQGSSANYEIETYPHIFKKLNWWEHREEKDMPKRLISKAYSNEETKELSDEVFEIQGWDMTNLLGWTNLEKRECCSLLSWNPEYGYFPID
jgi:hypothetical protein